MIELASGSSPAVSTITPGPLSVFRISTLMPRRFVGPIVIENVNIMMREAGNKGEPEEEGL